MTKFIEFGIGNRWLVRTEFEHEDGTEYEKKGIVGPIKPKSIYLRLWLGDTVLILDTKEGYQRQKKHKKAFKLIFGICSEE
ncbi:DUF3977 family protein [Streptococcus hillyeri]|uniref:DUF3977 family protein n=1 Tax=Streptococcus hillyeri TaxID=2282420 RepID=A0A3L9DTU3_9STRE|nr:DUF3977 family protein [Streptococcus hillyeri]RLY04741.1 DUF3977 family protein [Streptococcus hillyeri]